MRIGVQLGDNEWLSAKVAAFIADKTTLDTLLGVFDAGDRAQPIAGTP